MSPFLIYSALLTYVLKLENDCWYVGISTDLNKRLGQHFNNQGSIWTKKHAPIDIHRVYLGDREREMTIKMMRKYGIDKVRGSAWCKEKLSAATVTTLNGEILRAG